jgi:hypothetical protein
MSDVEHCPMIDLRILCKSAPELFRVPAKTVGKILMKIKQAFSGAFTYLNANQNAAPQPYPM